MLPVDLLPGAPSPSPQDLAAPIVGPWLERVEERLLDICGDGPEQLRTAAREAIAAGGKRLRPILVLLSARAAGEITDLSVDLGVAVEVLHVASLIHDDVVDEAALRRGKPAVRQVWGNRRAVLVGDYLAARAYWGLTHLQSSGFVHSLADTVMEMCNAELLFGASDRERLGPADCLTIARGKTAALLAASCQLGALSAGAGEPLAAALRDYGAHLGLAFQLTDDLLDVFGDDAVTGKDETRDLLSGQLTYPVAVALAGPQAPAVEGAMEALRAAPGSPSARAAFSSIVESAGGRQATWDLAGEEVALAQSALTSAPAPLEPASAAALAALASFLLTRIS
jgi:geranylgeranyl pyrophosphate synthase